MSLRRNPVMAPLAKQLAGAQVVSYADRAAATARLMPVPQKASTPMSLVKSCGMNPEPRLAPSATQGRKDGTYSLTTKDGAFAQNLTYDQYLKMRQEYGDMSGGKPLPPPDGYELPLPKSLQPDSALLGPSREGLLDDLDYR